MSKADTYQDFVAWRDSHDCEPVTVGDAARWFTGTSMRTLLNWWQRDQRDQQARSDTRTTQGRVQDADDAVKRGAEWVLRGNANHPFAGEAGEVYCRICGGARHGFQHA